MRAGSRRRSQCMALQWALGSHRHSAALHLSSPYCHQRWAGLRKAWWIWTWVKATLGRQPTPGSCSPGGGERHLRRPGGCTRLRPGRGTHCLSRPRQQPGPPLARWDRYRQWAQLCGWQLRRRPQLSWRRSGPAQSCQTTLRGQSPWQSPSRIRRPYRPHRGLRCVAGSALSSQRPAPRAPPLEPEGEPHSRPSPIPAMLSVGWERIVPEQGVPTPYYADLSGRFPTRWTPRAATPHQGCAAELVRAADPAWSPVLDQDGLRWQGAAGDL